MKEWTTPDSRNTPSTTNLEEEEIMDDPENDGNASMSEQVKRPNPWSKMIMMSNVKYLCLLQDVHGVVSGINSNLLLSSYRIWSLQSFSFLPIFHINCNFVTISHLFHSRYIPHASSLFDLISPKIISCEE